MPNRVGDPIPDQTHLDAIKDILDHLEAAVAPYTVDLSQEERQRVPKVRGGSEEIAALVANVMEARGLSLPDASAADIRADVLLAQRLQPVYDRLNRVLTTLNDTILAAEGEAWAATTMGYSALSRMSEADPKLANDLAPARAFFKFRGKRKTEE